MKADFIRAMEQCLRHLTTAASTAGLYATDHPQAVRLCREAHAALCRVLAERPELSLLRVDDQLAVAGSPLDRTLYAERFAQLLKRRGIGHIKFTAGIEAEELHALVCELAGAGRSVHSSGHLRLGQVEVRHRPAGETAVGALETDAARVFGEIGQEELARVMEVYEAVRHGRQLQVVGLSEIVAGFIDIFSQHADPLLVLVPLRDLDEYTFTHSLNVCLLNLAQATALGIDGDLLHDIGLAAMLHDIGKLFVPEEILNKPGKLTEAEWQMVCQHPVKGAEYLLDRPGVPRLAVINAYEHHLRFDLRGYPQVDAGWCQNLCSQMTSISDIYDSLRTRRPYRDPIGVETALGHIGELTGSQLHPVLAESFIRLMRKVHPEIASFAVSGSPSPAASP